MENTLDMDLQKWGQGLGEQHGLGIGGQLGQGQRKEIHRGQDVQLNDQERRSRKAKKSNGL